MIGSARQDGSGVRVYNEKGGLCCMVPGQLVGFTGSTVTARQGTQQRTYDENGRLLFMS